MTAVSIDTRTHARPLDVARLHFSQRRMLLATPPGIMAIVFVVTAIIAVIFLRSGAVPGSEQWVTASRSNGAVMWALPGFLGWLGVQTVSLTFPLALSLGSTRRAFVAGTVLTHLALAAYVTAILLVLLGVELATNHWFLGIYMVDVYVLGSGNALQLAVTAFLGVLVVLSIGGAFAAAWVRFGSLGPTALAAVTVIVLGIAAILLVPVFASFQSWWLLIAAAAAIVASVGAQYLCLRRASVR